MQVKFKKLTPEAHTPKYATEGAACMDISALMPEGAKITIPPGCSAEVHTGLAFEVPPGHVMKVYSRSGHGFSLGVRLANSVGIIDADYRGGLKVKIQNGGDADFVIKDGDRIAQAMILPYPTIELIESDELSETARGIGGGGSTGVAKL